MKNPELFHKTVGILVKAYQNDTLQNGNCYACAVGNIVASNMGYKFIKNPDPTKYHSGFINDGLVWDKLISHEETLTMVCNSGSPISEFHENQIKATGYSFEQIEAFERAFERQGYFGVEETMFNGLMAVVDTLMQIHEATTEEAQEAKELFVKV